MKAYKTEKEFTGWVYVLTNSHLPDWTKNGKAKDPAKRIKDRDINGAGTPGKWVIHKAYQCQHHEVERLLHAALRAHRLDPDQPKSEIFVQSPDAVCKRIELILEKTADGIQHSKAYARRIERERLGAERAAELDAEREWQRKQALSATVINEATAADAKLDQLLAQRQKLEVARAGMKSNRISQGRGQKYWERTGLVWFSSPWWGFAGGIALDAVLNGEDNPLFLLAVAVFVALITYLLVCRQIIYPAQYREEATPEQNAIDAQLSAIDAKATAAGFVVGVAKQLEADPGATLSESGEKSWREYKAG